MQSLIHMAGGIALLLWGAYMVKTGMLRTFGVALKDFLSVRLKNRAIAMASGTTLASLLQSSTAPRSSWRAFRPKAFSPPTWPSRRFSAPTSVRP